MDQKSFLMIHHDVEETLYFHGLRKVWVSNNMNFTSIWNSPKSRCFPLLETPGSVEVLHEDSTALLLAAKLDLELKLKEDKSRSEEEKGKIFHEITQFLIDNGGDVTALGNVK